MKYQTILFDLDGTITDPAVGITTSVAYALDTYGYAHDGIDSLRHFIGPPLREEFMKHCNVDINQGEALVSKYREYYSVKGIYQNYIYEGIIDLLSSLKNSGKTLILATSKPEKFAKIILEYFKILNYFDYYVGANMDNTRTDKAEVIQHALELSGTHDKSTAVMVGDRLHDVIGAKKNNLCSIGVTFGYGSRLELEQAGANIIVDSVNQLKAELLK